MIKKIDPTPQIIDLKKMNTQFEHDYIYMAALSKEIRQGLPMERFFTRFPFDKPMNFHPYLKTYWGTVEDDPWTFYNHKSYRMEHKFFLWIEEVAKQFDMNLRVSKREIIENDMQKKYEEKAYSHEEKKNQETLRDVIVQLNVDRIKLKEFSKKEFFEKKDFEDKTWTKLNEHILQERKLTSQLKNQDLLSLANNPKHEHLLANLVQGELALNPNLTNQNKPNPTLVQTNDIVSKILKAKLD